LKNSRRGRRLFTALEKIGKSARSAKTPSLGRPSADQKQNSRRFRRRSPVSDAEFPFKKETSKTRVAF